MGRDTEIQNRITTINRKIDELNARLRVIPGEIVQLEEGKRQLRRRATDTAKKLQEEGKIKESSEHIERSMQELTGIGRNIEEKIKEQGRLSAEIKALAAERAQLLAGA